MGWPSRWGGWLQLSAHQLGWGIRGGSRWCMPTRSTIQCSDCGATRHSPRVLLPPLLPSAGGRRLPEARVCGHHQGRLPVGLKGPPVGLNGPQPARTTIAWDRPGLRCSRRATQAGPRCQLQRQLPRLRFAQRAETSALRPLACTLHCMTCLLISIATHPVIMPETVANHRR